MQKIKLNIIPVIIIILINFIFTQDMNSVIQKGDLQKIKNMVQNEPKILEYTNDSENNYLHSAAKYGFNPIVKYLIKKGIDVNSKNIADETPLHYACAFGNDKVIRTLIRNGADINATNYNGDTPLHYSTQFRHIDSIKLLLSKGAQINPVNINSYTPLDYAVMLDDQDIINLLQKNGGKITHVGDPELVKITENIYRITFPYCEQSNIVLFKSKNGILLVDTGCNEKIIDKLKVTIDDFKSGKLKYIINTHLHFDHIAGNSVGGDTVPRIDFKNLDQMLKDKVISKNDEPLIGKSGSKFENIYNLKFGNDIVQLIPYPGIHTNDDLIIYFSKAGIVQMGDLLISQSFPSVLQKVPEYLDLLDRTINIFPSSTVFIGGHGKELTYNQLVDYYSMLKNTYTFIVQQFEDGKSIKEIRSLKSIQDYKSWGEFIPELSINYWINAIKRSLDSIVEKSEKDSVQYFTSTYLNQNLPGSIPELFAPGVVSDGLDNRDISFSPDGKELYYTSMVGGTEYVTVLTIKEINGIWSNPEVASFATDSKYMYYEPCMSSDGSKLYFTSNLPFTSDSNRSDPNIWYVERIDDHWSEPIALDTTINTMYDEYFPSVTSDNTLYFTRGSAEGIYSIYRSIFIDGKYTLAEKLPSEVNAGFARFNAFVSRDESYVILSIYGLEDAVGGMDYYIVFRNSDDTWNDPINLGENINTIGSDEYSPYVTPDGKYFFFMSKRSQKRADNPIILSYDFLQNIQNLPQNGYSDIYWVSTDFIRDLKSKSE